MTFTNLNYQIEIGLEEGYCDSEICFTIIASISPDIELQGYNPGKENITFTMLRKVQRSHFKGKDGITLVTMLCNATQDNADKRFYFFQKRTLVLTMKD